MATVALVLAATVPALVAAPIARAGGGPRVAAGTAGSGWIPDVNVAGATTIAYNPSITTAPNGDLFAAWVSVVAASGGILFRKSTDAGLTWGPAALVAAATVLEWPALAVDPYSGRAFVGYYVPGTRQVFVAGSDDQVAWTPVLVHDCSWGPYSGCGRLDLAVEYGNGPGNRVYVTLESQSGGDDVDVLVFRSDDHGRSWTEVLDEGRSFGGALVQPAIAVQKGRDGTDRVFVCYRSGGSSMTARDGMIEWSEDHGTTWHAAVRWTKAAGLPPAIAAAHDGSSVLVTTGSGGGPDVDWYLDLDPTNPSARTTAGTWTGLGYATHLAVDGGGTEDATIGGSYHVLATGTPGLNYLRVAVDFSTAGPAQPVANYSAAFTGADRDFALSTQRRGGTWWAAAAWTDFRSGVGDQVWYSTPGARLTFATSPPELTLVVDGTDRVAPITATYPAGAAIALDARSPQPAGTGSRYAFAAWSDGAAQSHVVSVGTDDATITATFAAEYMMTFLSAPPGLAVTFGGNSQTTPATFWVVAGTHRVDLDSPQPGTTGTRYRFANWSDGGAEAHDVVVTGPATLSATFTAEYRLTVTTAHGTATGSGWYDRGTTATFAVPAELTEDGRTWDFAGWSGDSTAASPDGTIAMDGAKTVRATWRERVPDGAGSGTGSNDLHVLLPALAVILLLIGALLWRRRRDPAQEPPAAAPPIAPRTDRTHATPEEPI